MVLVHVTTTSATARTFLSEHIRAQIAFGYEVILISNLSSQDEDFFRRELPNCSLVHIPFERKIKPRKDLVSFFRLYRLLFVYRKDLILVHTPKVGMLCAIIRRFLAKSDIIFYCHGLVSSYGLSINRKSFIYYLERFTLKGASKVVAVSHSLRDSIISEFDLDNNMVTVIGNGSISGVNNPKFQKSVEPVSRDTLVLGFVGRITDDKGIKDFLKSLSILHGVFNERIRGVVWGSEEDLEMEKLILNCGLSNEVVTYYGHGLERDDIYNSFDLLVFPSVREGFGMAVLEALSYGIPVVAYDVIGVHDIIVDNQSGYLVPVSDVEQLCSRIKLYLLHTELLSKHGEFGKNDSLQRFAQDYIINETLEYLNSK